MNTPCAAQTSYTTGHSSQQTQCTNATNLEDVYRDVVPCIVVDTSLRFRCAYRLHHEDDRPNDGGRRHLWNVGQTRICSETFQETVIFRLAAVKSSTVTSQNLTGSYPVRRKINRTYWLCWLAGWL